MTTKPAAISQARPKSPGNYAAEKKTRFVAWLTSANSKDPITLPDTKPAGGKVTVLGTGALGNGTGRAKLQVHLTPTAVTSGRQAGSFAWWIGGENQKARLPHPYQPEPATSAARWSVQAKSHAVADPEPFRLDSLLDDAASGRQGDHFAAGRSHRHQGCRQRPRASFSTTCRRFRSGC